jgi:hypothetical protein
LFPTDFQELERIRQREGGAAPYEYEVGVHLFALTEQEFERNFYRPPSSFSDLLWPSSSDLWPKFNGLVIGFFELADKSMSDQEWNDLKWTFVKTSLRGNLTKIEDIPKDDRVLKVLSQYKNADARRSVVAIKRADFESVVFGYVVTRFDEADGMGMFAEATVRKPDWGNYQNLVFNSLLSIQWSPSRARTMVRKMSSNP